MGSTQSYMVAEYPIAVVNKTAYWVTASTPLCGITVDRYLSNGIDKVVFHHRDGTKSGYRLFPVGTEVKFPNPKNKTRGHIIGTEGDMFHQNFKLNVNVTNLLTIPKLEPRG